MLTETSANAAMLDCVGGLTNLRHLAIKDCPALHMSSTALTALGRLTSIDLRGSTLSSGALVAVCGVTGLRSLNLWAIHQTSLPQRATALAALRELKWSVWRCAGALQLGVVWRMRSPRGHTLAHPRLEEVPDAISQLSACVAWPCSGALSCPPASARWWSSKTCMWGHVKVHLWAACCQRGVTALTKLASVRGYGIKAQEQSPAVPAFLEQVSARKRRARPVRSGESVPVMRMARYGVSAAPGTLETPSNFAGCYIEIADIVQVP